MPGRYKSYLPTNIYLDRNVLLCLTNFLDHRLLCFVTVYVIPSTKPHIVFVVSYNSRRWQPMNCLLHNRFVFGNLWRPTRLDKS